MFDQERPSNKGCSFLPFVFFVPLWLNQSIMDTKTLCILEYHSALKLLTPSWDFPAAAEAK